MLSPPDGFKALLLEAAVVFTVTTAVVVPPAAIVTLAGLKELGKYQTQGSGLEWHKPLYSCRNA
jgi:hypothetical protein